MRKSIAAICREITGAAHAMGDLRSFARYATDVILYRLLRVVTLAPRLRTIRLRDGTLITYRLNRGDILTVYEVWIAEIYRPPFPVGRLPTVIDLGANIGLTSVYLAQHHHSRVIAVEPWSANAKLAQRNLAQNGIPAEIVDAAVGARDGTANFAVHRDFNSGKLSGNGVSVPVVSMPTLLERIAPRARIDLLKVDIEGGEGELFSGDLGWLARVNALMIEFHPTLVEHLKLIDVIVAEGFRYIPAGSVSPVSMDAFVRAAPGDAGIAGAMS
jgi:FkbM family methyltransferase